MVESRCGLCCSGCGFKESHGCRGCIETMGNPFYGECPIADCCQKKGLTHCGECDVIPCEKLYDYSYLDPEHGDKPQGARVSLCRAWAAESRKQVWENVLLTSAGFEDADGKQRDNIVRRFLEMLRKPTGEATVLFITAAAVDDEARKMVDYCYGELMNLGFRAENVRSYGLDESMSEDEAMRYDVVYFTGGSTAHLLRRLKEYRFDETVKKMVYAGKVYVGVSAGSLIATPNIGEPFDADTAGLCLVNAYISVHQPVDSEARIDLPLPHVPLSDEQALVVGWNGYEVISK